jgi:hypothetical protein
MSAYAASQWMAIHYLNGVLVVAPHLVRSWQVSDAELFIPKAPYLQIADTDWLH